MQEETYKDIRRLLKNFGMLADENIVAHIEKLASHGLLHIRLSLEDLTDYAGHSPPEPLQMEIEGDVRY